MKQSNENPRARRKPRKITPDSLGRIALHYLERYATSSENLRRVLTRRVRRSAEAHDADPDEQMPHVDALIVRYQQAGLLDDQAYARMRAESLHRRGTSGRMIRMKLAAKGVASDAIDDALESLSELVANADLSGACNYARRRRIGPWRLRDRADYRDRDLAALARQGFSYNIARKIIDAEDTEMLEAEAAEAKEF
jgi:regulatory protein